MNKILTISIAAYNVEKFIEKTLDSLIIENIEDLEVLIINDGSKDKTAEIAKKYEEKYPTVFKLINKTNGGYGSTINEGIKNATGKYFKQLDGDDCFVKENLNELCLRLKELDVDMVYTPYMENNVNESNKINKTNTILNYSNETQLEKVIQYANPVLQMYSLLYKTEILKKNDIKIDENCFYTDTEYVIFPMLYCKKIAVLNLPIYIYRTGDENQSIGKLGRKKHYKDHLKMSNSILAKVPQIEQLSDNLKNYFQDYFASVFASGIANYLMTLKPTKSNYELIKNWDNTIYDVSKEIYGKMGEYSRTVRIIRKYKYPAYVAINKIKDITS